MNQLYFAQKAFIVRQGALLLVRKSDDDPNQPGKWEVPGGRMNFGEEVDAHIKREVREEVGLEIIPGVPFHVWQWRLSRTAEDGSQVEMQIVAVARFCEPVSYELSDRWRVDEDFLAEMAWVPFGDLARYDLIPNMLPVMESFSKRIEGLGACS